MQLLFQTPDVRVSFFSLGAERENIPFVEQLLIRSLGEERYTEVKVTVRIFSGKKRTSSSDLLDLDSDKDWWIAITKQRNRARVISSRTCGLLKPGLRIRTIYSKVQYDKYGIYYSNAKNPWPGVRERSFFRRHSPH